METRINFSGISFEVGQRKKGLTLSSQIARNYFSSLKHSGMTFIDHGDVSRQETTDDLKIFSDFDLVKIEWQHYEQAYLKTLNLLRDPATLLNWGGDHSMAISSVGAFTTAYPDGYVIWIDAHADLNLPEESETGNLHGMPLSILLNLNNVATEHFSWLKNFLRPQKLIYVGLRDVDAFEKICIESLGIKAFFNEDITLYGMDAIAREILRITHNQPTHISFDIDSVDPQFAPSTGVPVKGGISPYDLFLLGRKLSNHSLLRSIDIVEINPYLGTMAEIEQTYTIAFNFLRSLFFDKYYSGGIYDSKKYGKSNTLSSSA